MLPLNTRSPLFYGSDLRLAKLREAVHFLAEITPTEGQILLSLRRSLEGYISVSGFPPTAFERLASHGLIRSACLYWNGDRSVTGGVHIISLSPLGELLIRHLSIDHQGKLVMHPLQDLLSQTILGVLSASEIELLLKMAANGGYARDTDAELGTRSRLISLELIVAKNMLTTDWLPLVHIEGAKAFYLELTPAGRALADYRVAHAQEFGRG